MSYQTSARGHRQSPLKGISRYPYRTRQLGRFGRFVVYLTAWIMLMAGVVAWAPAAAAAPATLPLRVDFGIAGMTPAAGYELDYGQAFGARTGANQGQGLTYGWTTDGTTTPVDLTGGGRVRSGTGVGDAKQTSLMHMQPSGRTGSWEAEVANGTYTVTIGVGDASTSFYDSVHAATVEGQVAVYPFTPSWSNQLQTGTVTVTVTDGRLTVRPTGGSNVKITFLTIDKAATATDVTFPFKVDFGAQSSTPVDGNILDYGRPYQAQDAGEYGWVAEGTSNPLSLFGDGRQRSTGGLTDLRQSNFVHMQARPTGPGAWELKVPNGTYRVTAGVGDAGWYYDSTNVVLAEGLPVIPAFTPSPTVGRFTSGTADVQVTDGRLTISATGGTNAKLDYLEILQWDDPPLPNFPLNIDFGPASTPPAAGYVLDSGGAYGARPGGYSYGWVAQGTTAPLDVSANARVRTGTATTDPRLTSLIHMQAGTGATTPAAWQLAVPNGTYEVTVGVGDAMAAFDSKHAVEVENIQVIAPFTPTTNNRFATGTTTVSVIDGRLTVDADGGTNTKITYLTVKYVDPTRPRVAMVAPSAGQTDVVRDMSVTTELYLPTGATNPNTVTEQTVRLVKVSDGSVVPSSANTSGGGDVLVLTPTATLEANTQYRFEVTDGVKDVAGHPFLPFESVFTTGNLTSGTGIPGVAFTQEQTVAKNKMYTSITTGPDGRLYAATLNGFLFRYDMAADGTLSNEQQINTVRAMNDNTNRTIIGLAFDPASTADNLILWVTDNYMYVGNANVPDWSSKIDRLTGANLENGQTVVTNLPRSAHDHEANSLAFGPDGKLYFPMGSNTGMGYPDVAWGNRAEVQLSGAILRLDPSALPGQLPLDVKTADGGGSYDPRASSAPLTIYATGVRNAYDLVWASNGKLYAPTNGSAAGANIPSVPGTLPASCANRIDASANGPYTYSGPTFGTIFGNPGAQTDFIHKITPGGYYGHPNPSRCEFISYGGNPTSGADPWQEGQYPVGVQPDRNFRAGDIYDAGLHASANGSVEYRSNAFGGKLKGKLLVVRYSAGKDIEVVDNGGPDGSVKGITTGVTGFSGFTEPLDIVEHPSGNGVLYVTELGGQKITVLRPAA